MLLDEEEIEIVVQWLDKVALSHTELEEELLDHICCQIEEQMGLGKSFEQSFLEVQELWKIDQIKEIEESTIYLTHQKNIEMKRFALLISLSLFIFIGVAWGQLSDFELTSPVKGGEIASDFGMKVHPIFLKHKMHKGVDYKAAAGTPVVVAESGIIIAVKNNRGGYGTHIIVEHNDSLKTLYAHLSETIVTEGETVEKGQEIGKVGNTGASTAPHLHFEVLRNDVAVDPKDYLGGKENLEKNK